MRPVTINPKPDYEIPDNMVTNTPAIRNGLVANDVEPVAGKNTFDIEEVLALLKTLTYENKGADKWSKLGKTNKALVTALIRYFSNNEPTRYLRARGSLITNYGQYCNYCGMPVQDTFLAVEHRLPKSEFPSLMLQYKNFFLACPMCNSYKGSKPGYATSKSWAINEQDIPKPDMTEIGDGGFDSQTWPNRTHAYKGFTPVLYDVSTQLAIPLKSALDVRNVVVNTNNNTVQAIIQGYNKNKQVTVAVRFEAVDAGVQGKREKNFIDIINLNFTKADSYSDRRVTNRTVAWMNALQTMSFIQSFTPGSPQYTRVVNQSIANVKSAGYYSIWAYIFYQISPPTNNYSVYTSFKTQSADPNNQLTYFPGTNSADMP